MERVLNHLGPRLLPEPTTYKVITFRGKPDLLRKLPGRLIGYSYRTAEQLGIVVLVDEDREDCLVLKEQLEAAARAAGLSTQSTSANFRVLNRIVVEELEAWLFGDASALTAAYPRLRTELSGMKFRHPDRISGGTAEALGKLLHRYGYHSEVLLKLDVADRVGPHLQPGRNSSPSFQVFVQGLERLIHSLVTQGA